MVRSRTAFALLALLAPLAGDRPRGALAV